MIGFAVQNERTPAMIPMVASGGFFLHIGFRRLAAADLDAEFQSWPIGGLRLPLNIEAKAGTLIGILPQEMLVSIALIEAWGQGVPTFLIKQVGQDLDDLGGGRFPVAGGTSEQR